MQSCAWIPWKRLAPVVALSGCLIVAGTPGANSQSDQDAMSMSIEQLAHAKVFSASRHLEDSRQAPSSVSVISAQDIREYGWRTLGEALRSLRGFYTSYDRDYTDLGVRGFQRPGDYNSRVLLLVNGHRLNDNVFDSALIGTEFELDLDLIDHIEIVRGPSSSLFGTNAVFGVINVITRRSDSGGTIETSGEAASHLGRTGRVTSTFKLGKLSGLVSGSLFRSDGQSRLFYPEFASPETNNGWAENLDGDRSGHVFGDLQFGNFRAFGLFSSRKKTIPTGPFQTNFNDSSNRSNDRRALVDLTYRRAFSLGDVDIRGYYDDYDSLGTGAFGGTDPTTRYLAKTWGGANWVGIEASVDRQIGRHRIVVGSEYEYSMKVAQKNAIVGQPAFFADSRQLSRSALYGEGELDLIPKLSVRFGARLDWFSIYGNSASPRIAAVYSPNSRTALKYIYGEAFRAPNAYENYYADGVVFEAPRRRLNPETLVSHELIFEQGLNPWLQISLDGSYNKLQDLIDQTPDIATGLSHFANSGRDNGRTIEAEMVAKRASGLAARVSYTLEYSTDGLQHRRMANAPLAMTKFHGAVPLSHHSFGGIEVLYSSAQSTYQGTHVPSSVITNTTFSTGPMFNGFEFSASLYNAFDYHWFAPAGPELRQAEIQQDGRTVRFKLSRTFSYKRASR